MLFVVIISIVSLFLDLILSNFLPYMVNDLSLFTTMFSTITIFLVYKLFDDDKKYFIYSFIFGVIYDLFLTNLFLYDGIVFLFIAYISYLIYKNFEVNSIRNVIYIVLIIIIYELVFALSILLFNLVPISINKVFYKITHSLISNIIYGEFIYFIIKHITKKYRIRKINR